ncbi:glycine oxidase ThiO [Bacillus sp. SB49]|uniref:glycine oxidase ThiO n=1 Tax=Bacillus sp. SB49 TaxID=1071080 RepID=UPI0003FFF219|nr:glycine oxidase ThiO [Bacillus sp. SB49]QHT47043.1 glycine oxidase ThiO [Bacillus sp. SB49]
MKNHWDTVIVGGGIIGHSISYHLSKAGADVCVLDKGTGGRRATGAAAGMLGVHTENRTPGLYHEFCVKSRDMYNELHTELYQCSGIDIQLTTNGMLQIALDEREAKELQEKQQSFPSLSWLDDREMKIRHPWVKSSGALWMREDGNVKPEKVAEAFKRGARSFGSTVKDGCFVIRIRKSGQGYEVTTNEGEIFAERIVVAAGADSGPWFRETGLPNPMVPVKGECFSIKPRNLLFQETYFSPSFYVVPKRDGSIVIGATSREGDGSESTSAGGIADLMDQVFRVFPALREEPLEKWWSGVRPGTSDGRPVIGEHPQEKGIFFATGHYRNGILLAPATGKLIQSLFEKGTFAKKYEGLFSPARFQIGGVYEHTR